MIPLPKATGVRSVTDLVWEVDIDFNPTDWPRHHFADAFKRGPFRYPKRVWTDVRGDIVARIEQLAEERARGCAPADYVDISLAGGIAVLNHEQSVVDHCQHTIETTLRGCAIPTGDHHTTISQPCLRCGESLAIGTEPSPTTPNRPLMNVRRVGEPRLLP